MIYVVNWFNLACNVMGTRPVCKDPFGDVSILRMDGSQPTMRDSSSELSATTDTLQCPTLCKPFGKIINK